MAKMILMVAAMAVSAFKTSSGTEYTANEDQREDGLWEIHPEHAVEAELHGFTVFDERTLHTHSLAAPVLGPDTEVVDEMAAKDARIAELEALLAEKPSEGADAPDATDTPAEGADAPGDASEGAGGTGDDEDKLGAALALEPNFNEMGRDEMVEWLEGVGVSIAANVSTAVARSAIDSTVADYNASKA